MRSIQQVPSFGEFSSRIEWRKEKNRINIERKLKRNQIKSEFNKDSTLNFMNMKIAFEERKRFQFSSLRNKISILKCYCKTSGQNTNKTAKLLIEISCLAFLYQFPWELKKFTWCIIKLQSLWIFLLVHVYQEFNERKVAVVIGETFKRSLLGNP